MVDLIKRTAQKAAPVQSREAQRTAKKRENFSRSLKAFSDLAGNTAPNVACQHMLAGQPVSIPGTMTRKAEADPFAEAPTSIQRLAQRHGTDAGRLLLAMHLASEKAGDPVVRFDATDAAEVIQCDRGRAGYLIDHLVASGTLLPQRGAAGGLIGYAINGPAGL